MTARLRIGLRRRHLAVFGFGLKQLATGWSSDILCIATHGVGLYLAAVIDHFSRQGVGWQTQAHRRPSLVAHALRKA